MGHRGDLPMAGNMSTEEDSEILVSLHSLLLPSQVKWFCSTMSSHNYALPEAKTMAAANHGLKHVDP